jgi:hypothetical protein
MVIIVATKLPMRHKARLRVASLRNAKAQHARDATLSRASAICWVVVLVVVVVVFVEN